MKKLIVLLFLSFLVLGACGQKEEATPKEESAKKTESKEVKKEEPKKNETDDKKDKIKKDKESVKKSEPKTEEQSTEEINTTEQSTQEQQTNEQRSTEGTDTTSVQYQNSRQCLLDLGAGNRASAACENMGNNKSINLQAFNDLQAEGYLCDNVAGCVTQEEMDKQQNEDSIEEGTPDSSGAYENDEDIEQQEMDEISRKMDDPNISDDEYNKLVDEYNSYID